jgi:hypothetical protein
VHLTKQLGCPWRHALVLGWLLGCCRPIGWLLNFSCWVILPLLLRHRLGQVTHTHADQAFVEGSEWLLHISTYKACIPTVLAIYIISHSKGKAMLVTIMWTFNIVLIARAAM